MEEVFFSQWAEHFRSFVAGKNPQLLGYFTVGTVQDAEGNLVPYFHPTAEAYIGKEKSDELNDLWEQYVSQHPF